MMNKIGILSDTGRFAFLAAELPFPSRLYLSSSWHLLAVVGFFLSCPTWGESPKCSPPPRGAASPCVSPRGAGLEFVGKWRIDLDGLHF